MKLGKITSGLSIEQTTIPSTLLEQLEIHQIQEDSRRVSKGDLFVAIPGHQVDGHHFLLAAQTQGAAACVVEQIHPSLMIPQIQVSSTAEALPKLAANFYGHPKSDLLLCAVTGTNGKTTTSFLVESMLSRAGYSTGMLGTILYRYPGKSRPAPLTTPGALELQKTLAEMRDHKVNAVMMEASSHALSLHRLDGISFRVAAFTNLSQDHLDFHETMEHYFQAKTRLFHEHLASFEQGGRAVICVDNEYGKRLANQLPPAQVILVALKRRKLQDFGSDFAQFVYPIECELSLKGISTTLDSPQGPILIESPLCGGHNLENLVVAAGVGVALNIDAKTIGTGLSALSGVPGRLERVPTRLGQPMVFVDYAHTPDALFRTLRTLRLLSPEEPPKPRLLVVFGCGGERDPSKRKKMGQTASQEADIVILTSDNPRTEDPGKILQMVEAGLSGPRLSSEDVLHATSGYLVEPDRKKAIATAILAAKPTDIILIAGKGHENYQIIGTEKYPFDDKQEAILALQARALTFKT